MLLEKVNSFCIRKICGRSLSNGTSLSYKQIKGFLNRHMRRRKFGNYSIVKPTDVSPMRTIPGNISVPCYFKSKLPLPAPKLPEVKTEEQIKGMRESCRLAREVLDSLKPFIKVGVTTDEVDGFVHDLVISRGAYPSPLNYRGYPKSICTSVNNVVCHGIPDSRPLEDGDIVNVDITVYYQGFHGDCSAMFLLGSVDEKGRHLVRTTLEALNAAINVCGPDKPLSLIGNTISKIAEMNNFKVVPYYAGHGIGSYFHGPPDINHYANNQAGKMVPGMTFTIEPILSQGSPKIVILRDKWTSVTVDGGRTAQWEHTVLITETGVELLTGPNYMFPL